MPRILIVNSADVIRKTTETLARGLSERGYDICVVTPKHPKSDGYFDDDESIELVPYESLFVPKIRYSVPRYDFLEIMRREIASADAVVITSALYLSSFVGTLLSKRSNTPTVITVDALVGFNWSYGRSTIDLVGKLFVHTLSRFAFRSADRVIGLTGTLEEHLRELATESKIRIIPNGIDTEHFSPPVDRADGMEPPIELLFVGRLSPVKGVEYLLSAFNQLRADQREIHLTVVGDGEQSEAYMQQAEQMGIDDAITWTGWVDDVKPYYDAADLLVLPSISEGQPSVLMEAQACGLPVVATAVGGVPELVEAGRVVPPEDSDALRTGIIELTEEDPAQLCAEGRSFVVERYSKESMVEKYLTVFSDISTNGTFDSHEQPSGPARPDSTY